MIARNFKTEPVKENPHGVAVTQLYNDPSAQIVHILLQPGEKLLPHKTPVDVTFYVIEGIVTIQIGEEFKDFEQDFLIESPANVIHTLINNSKQNTRVLVIKAPRPEKTVRLL